MPKTRENIQRVMKGVQASMAVEGLKPSRKVKLISQKYLEGKLSSEEAVGMIIDYHIDKEKRKQ
ncbi:MAG: antitoxin VbhA family protein [Syntrophomonadaceae bacterium]